MERRQRKRSLEGITLIEAALVVALVGVVLAVFVPTFIRELRISKLAEAPEQLDRLYRRSAAYYAATHGEGEERKRYCLPEAAGPTPALPSVDPIEVDFQAEDVEGAATWEALSFDPGPIRYRYTFIPEEAGCATGREAGSPALTLRAEGDLDGDGILSRFERRAAPSDEHLLVPYGVLYVEERVE